MQLVRVCAGGCMFGVGFVSCVFCRLLVISMCLVIVTVHSVPLYFPSVHTATHVVCVSNQRHGHSPLPLSKQLMREALDEEADTLLVCSCYSIGKERAYLGAAAALGLKVGGGGEREGEGGRD